VADRAEIYASTFTSIRTFQRAELVIPSVNAHIVVTSTPDLGADGKAYRANFVHAPFPEKSAPKRPLRGSVVRRLPACETSLAM
jgi:hypothetical protein